MNLKKAFKLILLILAICAVGAGCTYIVRHMLNFINDSRKYAGVGVVIAGGICIISSLIKSILETVQK